MGFVAMTTYRRAYWQSEHMRGIEGTQANSKCQCAWFLLWTQHVHVDTVLWRIFAWLLWDHDHHHHHLCFNGSFRGQPGPMRSILPALVPEENVWGWVAEVALPVTSCVRTLITVISLAVVAMPCHVAKCTEHLCFKNSNSLECGPMPNVMVALPNIGGALCSTP